MSQEAAKDPIARFKEAFEQASTSEPFEASRAALATATTDGRPSVRFVLVKQVDSQGFNLFTNLTSPKAQDLKNNPRAELAFHWFTIGQQVRVYGPVEPVTDAEGDAYFASRPRGSQIGAWASEQSRPAASREQLDAQVAEVSARFEGKDVPRPDFWSGFRLVPERIEFWHNRDDRLHDRFCYIRQGTQWSMQRLQP